MNEREQYPESEEAPVSDQDIENAIQDAAEQVEQEKAAHQQVVADGERRPRRPLDSPVLAAILLIAAGVLTALNLSGRLPFTQRASDVDAQDLGRMLELQLYLVVEDIEDFRDEFGRLPETLEEIDMSVDDGVEYSVMSESVYRVAVFYGDLRFEHESTPTADGEEATEEP